jgi:hypothetical protein
MQVDTLAGLSLGVVLGATAYLDYTSERFAKTAVAHASIKQSGVLHAMGIALVFIIAALLIGVCGYMFSQVPVRLWEMTAVLIGGSLAWRLILRVA